MFEAILLKAFKIKSLYRSLNEASRNRVIIKNFNTHFK